MQVLPTGAAHWRSRARTSYPNSVYSIQYIALHTYMGLAITYYFDLRTTSTRPQKTLGKYCQRGCCKKSICTTTKHISLLSDIIQTGRNNQYGIWIWWMSTERVERGAHAHTHSHDEIWMQQSIVMPACTHEIPWKINCKVSGGWGFAVCSQNAVPGGPHCPLIK